MIGVRNDIPSQEIQVVSTLELIIVQIFVQPKNVIICNVYLPPGVSGLMNKLEEILNKLLLDNPVLLIGDFNAHHELWDCRK